VKARTREIAMRVGVGTVAFVLGSAVIAWLRRSGTWPS